MDLDGSAGCHVFGYAFEVALPVDHHALFVCMRVCWRGRGRGRRRGRAREGGREGGREAEAGTVYRQRERDGQTDRQTDMGKGREGEMWEDREAEIRIISMQTLLKKGAVLF
jgi:hypothetical protein